MKIKVSNEPFRHVILDNFLPLGFADNVYKELKDIEITDEWYKYESPWEKKRSTDKWELFPKFISQFMMTSLTGPFIKMVEEMLDINALAGDGSLRGGGIHCQERDSFLGIHADFNVHPQLKLHRRVNGILYMNKEWDDDWNGFLEFWSSDMERCEKRIAPKFNRLVLFEIHDKAFHGLPDPVTCPNTHRRMSLAFYLYSADRPDNEKTLPHSTLFQKRPQDITTPELEELRSKRNKGRLASNV
jgi:Rps23 Pro-64 3,4-dihydroxylase Tpa1-like proline 4-hydroxylase